MREFTDAQLAEMQRLKSYFPYRIIYGAFSPDGEFEAGAQKDRRRINKLLREGWQVATLST